MANQIVLMPKTPMALYCYWELSEFSNEAARKSEDGTRSLRLLDIADVGSARVVYEKICAEGTDSAHLSVPVLGRTYRVEIGYLDKGKWWPFACSNPITVPDGQVCEELGNKFVAIPFDQDLKEVRGQFQSRIVGTEETTGDQAGGGIGRRIMPMTSFEHLTGSQGYSTGSGSHVPGSFGNTPGSGSHVPGSFGHIGRQRRKLD
ncbi:MAG: DUF4912 domain-containing protein [Pseudomonadota bacterium]